MVAWLSSCPIRRGRRDFTSQSCDGCCGRTAEPAVHRCVTYRERKSADTIGTVQGRFPGLAISNAKILIYLSNKIYGSNLSNSTWKLNKITIMAWNYQKADCSLRKKYILCHFCNFWHLFSFPMAVARQVFCRRCDALFPTSTFTDGVIFPHSWFCGGMSVTLQRRAQANPPAVSYWLRPLLSDDKCQEWRNPLWKGCLGRSLRYSNLLC